MKASKVGIMAVAILLVVTGIGFGIAQAGGTHSEQPVLSFEDMEATQVAISPVEYTQMQNPIETGSLPYEELHGTEFPFPVGFVADSNEDLDPFSRGGP